MSPSQHYRADTDAVDSCQVAWHTFGRMRAFVYTLSTFPKILCVAGKRSDAVVPLRGSPVKWPSPGLKSGYDLQHS